MKTGVTWKHTFANLPIYAPNGEKYVYKVVEVKEEFLDGYATWAVKGPVTSDNISTITQDTGKQGTEVTGLEAKEAPEGDEPSVTLDTATFINKRDADSVTLQGTKVWDDWSNEMDLRPENAENVITLTVSAARTPSPG